MKSCLSEIAQKNKIISNLTSTINTIITERPLKQMEKCRFFKRMEKCLNGMENSLQGRKL
jgi:hypothetical protein